MSGRPLLITDCDEVLLHMVGPFKTWLERDHAIDFDLEGENFEGALVRRHDASVVEPNEIWPLLDNFFTNQMHSQTLVPHADRALATIAEVADIVVLTNITEQFHAGRVDQLAALDIRHRVQCNQGGKGEPIARLVEEFQPSVTVFVDDTPFHHSSVAKYAPEVWRLHMIAEPRVAVRRPPAPDAHARIDDWADALPWILGRFGEGAKAAA